jgi:hypothetical protein
MYTGFSWYTKGLIPWYSNPWHWTPLYKMASYLHRTYIHPAIYFQLYLYNSYMYNTYYHVTVVVLFRNKEKNLYMFRAATIFSKYFWSTVTSVLVEPTEKESWLDQLCECLLPGAGLMPLIQFTQEIEMRRITIWSQLQATSAWDPISNIPNTKWLKW